MEFLNENNFGIVDFFCNYKIFLRPRKLFILQGRKNNNEIRKFRSSENETN